MIAVRGDSPYGTLHDLLDAARLKPDALTLAGVGPASSVHIGFAMIAHAANVNITFVPYAGPGPAVNALLGGHVASSVPVPYAAVASLLNAGKLRALGISSRTRVEALPAVPTIAESGFRGYEMDIWFGVVAPANTPNATSSRLADWFSAALQDVRRQGAARRSGYTRSNLRHGVRGRDSGEIRRVRPRHSRREHRGGMTRRPQTGSKKIGTTEATIGPRPEAHPACLARAAD